MLQEKATDLIDHSRSVADQTRSAPVAQVQAPNQRQSHDLELSETA
jgi:hypothetical protein